MTSEQRGVYRMEYLEVARSPTAGQTAAQVGLHPEALSVSSRGSLDYAHSGLITRRQPANILFAPTGDLLTDFVSPGAIVPADPHGCSGTPEYMSRSRPRRIVIGARTYTPWGSCLRDATGRSVPGNTPTTLHSVVYEHRRHRARLSPAVAGVEAALLQALAKRPEARFQQAAAARPAPACLSRPSAAAADHGASQRLLRRRAEDRRDATGQALDRHNTRRHPLRRSLERHPGCVLAGDRLRRDTVVLLVLPRRKQPAA